MSNTIVGDVYAQVIDRVKEEAADIFEEAGIPASVLEELQQEWRRNLSQTKVATFPWDSPPPPEPLSPVAVSVASQHGGTGTDPLTDIDPTGQMYDPHNPGSFANYDQPKSFPGSSLNTQAAQQRAASLLREKYGTQANASIAAGIAQHHQPASTQQPADSSSAFPFPSDTKPTVADQSRPPLLTVVNQTGTGPAQAGDVSDPGSTIKQEPHLVVTGPATAGASTGVTGVKSEQDRDGHFDQSQTDGPGEWKTYLSQDSAELSNANSSLRSLIDAAALEATSGLMASFDQQEQRHRQRQQARRSRKKGKELADPVGQAGHLRSASGERIGGQVDGDYEDDDLDDDDDDDLINSELDDPDDAVPDEGDDMGSFIVCTYEKVARVKTKWKATLLDGILKTNGKNFLFHRATSDLEW